MKAVAAWGASALLMVALAIALDSPWSWLLLGAGAIGLFMVGAELGRGRRSQP